MTALTDRDRAQERAARIRAGKEKLSLEDVRRMGLLDELPIDELPSSNRILLEELRVKDMREVPQIQRDGLVRQMILGGVGGRIQVDGETLDLETETREIAGE